LVARGKRLGPVRSDSLVKAVVQNHGAARLKWSLVVNWMPAVSSGESEGRDDGCRQNWNEHTRGPWAENKVARGRIK